MPPIAPIGVIIGGAIIIGIYGRIIGYIGGIWPIAAPIGTPCRLCCIPGMLTPPVICCIGFGGAPPIPGADPIMLLLLSIMLMVGTFYCVGPAGGGGGAPPPKPGIISASAPAPALALAAVLTPV